MSGGGVAHGALFGEVGEVDVGGHAGAEVGGVGGEPDFDAEDLFDAVLGGLDVAGGEFGGAGDLFDFAGVFLVGKGVDFDADFLGELEVAEPGGGDVNADPKVGGEEDCGDGGVGLEDVAGFDVEGFDDCGAGGGDFEFFELGFEFGKLGFDLGDAFGAGAGEEEFVAAFGGGEAFLEGGGAGDGAVAVGGGDGARVGQLCGAFFFGAGELEFGGDGFEFGLGGGNFFAACAGLQLGQEGEGLCFAGVKFGGEEADEGFAGFGGVAFADEDFSDAAAVAGGEAGFIGFNRARDGAVSLRCFGAGNSQQDQCDKRECVSHRGELTRLCASSQEIRASQSVRDSVCQSYT